MDSKILLSIIICTRNRAEELVNCLPEVARQASEFADVEVIVVDNGSTDKTADTIEQLMKKLDYSFRYIFEPVAGLCTARNRGRAEARGEILAYIDDDVSLKENWVELLRRHFIDNRSDCLAGKVTSELGAKPPFQMDETMFWFFCTTNLGDEPKQIFPPDHPIGCNMAFRKEVFDSVGGFDPNLKLYGDETDFFRRVYANGNKVLYDPSIELSQVIPASRLTIEEMRHKSYIWGKGSAMVWMLSSPGLLKRIQKICEFAFRVGYLTIRRNTDRKSFGKFYTLWHTIGYFFQLVLGVNK